MGNDQNDQKKQPQVENENVVDTDVSALAISDKFDSVDKVFADLERQAKDNAGRVPEQNPVGVRDLTDEELRKLKDSFQEGLRSLEEHPWFGKKE